MPTDPEFASAFTAYIEWQSCQFLQRSQNDALAPSWSWGPAGPPPPPTLSTAVDDGADLKLADAERPMSFEVHIRPLFRQKDRQSMAFAFDLWSYDAVKAQAQSILERLQAGSMPCDGPWPKEKTDLFQRWIDDGTPP